MNCPNCQEIVEEKFRRCPNCGAPNPGFKKETDADLKAEVKRLQERMDELEKNKSKKDATVI